MVYIVWLYVLVWRNRLLYIANEYINGTIDGVGLVNAKIDKRMFICTSPVCADRHHHQGRQTE